MNTQEKSGGLVFATSREVFALRGNNQLWKCEIASRYGQHNPDSFRQIVDGENIVYGIFRLRNGCRYVYDLITGEELDFPTAIKEIAFVGGNIQGIVDTSCTDYTRRDTETPGTCVQYELREWGARGGTDRKIQSWIKVYPSVTDLRDYQADNLPPSYPFGPITIDGDMYYAYNPGALFGPKGIIIRKRKDGSKEEIGKRNIPVRAFVVCGGVLFDGSADYERGEPEKSPFDYPSYHIVHNTIKDEEIFRIGGEPVFFHPHIGAGARIFLNDYNGILLVTGTFAGLHMIDPKNYRDSIIFPEISGVTAASVVSHNNLENLINNMKRVA